MEFAVKFIDRVDHDLEMIYGAIDASNSDAALKWYLGLRDAIMTLRSSPNRCPATPEDRRLKHLLYGRKPDVYRLIFEIRESSAEVLVFHIRHGARAPFTAADLN